MRQMAHAHTLYEPPLSAAIFYQGNNSEGIRIIWSWKELKEAFINNQHSTAKAEMAVGEKYLGGVSEIGMFSTIRVWESSAVDVLN